MIENIDDALDELKDSAVVNLQADEAIAGFEILWSLKGFGFGQLLFYYSIKRGKWVTDTERMSAETVTKILQLAAPSMAKMMVEFDP